MFKLIKLSANKDSFHEITFKNGLNVIVGKPTSKKAIDKKKTTNGIGKSLIIKIIDFCLGADKINGWELPLHDWIFTLDISIDDIPYTISRAVNTPNKFSFNGTALSLTKFKETMKELLKLSPDFSFRQIIHRFLRKGKNGYVNYLTTIKDEKESDTLMIVCYLLGIDHNLCKEKIRLKKELVANTDLRSKTQKDSAFRELFGIGNFDLELELGNISFEIEQLEKEIANNNFAENYSDIQDKANQISSILDKLNNKKFIIEDSIRAINNALQREISIDVSDVQNVYNDINVFFEEQLQHSLEEVVDFHKRLLATRKQTLSKDLLQFKKELLEIEKDIDTNNKQLNEYLSFLDAHTAMDKYIVAIRRIDLLKSKKQELLKIANIEKDLQNKIEQLNTDLSTSNINAQIYLDSVETKRETFNKQFVNLAKTLYSEKKSALTVKVNSGKNQVRFNVEARITSDGSDGINEMVTFCFDWVLLMQQITKQGFLYHDSLLFANAETRQKEIIFQIICDLCGKDYQYIINVNEDQIQGFDFNTRAIIDNNTILILTDKDIQSKLLGIEVDLGRELDEQNADE